MGFRSSLCMFSTMARSMFCSSSSSLTMQGTSLSSALTEALHLLSPATISYPLPFFLTIRGWIMPFSLMEAANSAIFSSSKTFLGWFALGLTSWMLIYWTVSAGSAFSALFFAGLAAVSKGFTSLVTGTESAKSASRPLPRPPFLVPAIYSSSSSKNSSAKSL